MAPPGGLDATRFGDLREWIASGRPLAHPSHPGGFLLPLPEPLKAKVTIGGSEVFRSQDGDWLIPAGTKQVQIELAD